MVNNITKSRKAILWLLALVMALTAVIPLSTLKANAAKGGNEIKYEGKISWGGTTVGKFKIGNTLAFCLEHKKDTPATGTGYTQTPYDNPKVVKVLYYGWGGQGQWSGFQGNEAKGYVITSLALDHYHTGTKHDMAGYNEFIKFVESQPAPPSKTVAFDKSEAKVHWDEKEQKQISEKITILGDKGDSLTFTLKDGITLVKEDGTKLTGKVTIPAKTSFHLEATSKVDGLWTTGDVGVSWKYQSFILKTPATSIQDLATIQPIVDPEFKTSLSVKWLDFGEFELTKIDEMSQFLDGAEFEIKSLDPATGYNKGVRYKAENGKLLIDALPVGTYTLTEVVKPDSYDKPVKAFTIVVQKDKKTTQIAVNRLNPSGVVKILKTDKDSKANIEGAEFTLIN